MPASAHMSGLTQELRLPPYPFSASAIPLKRSLCSAHITDIQEGTRNGSHWPNETHTLLTPSILTQPTEEENTKRPLQVWTKPCPGCSFSWNSKCLFVAIKLVLINHYFVLKAVNIFGLDCWHLVSPCGPWTSGFGIQKTKGYRCCEKKGHMYS